MFRINFQRLIFIIGFFLFVPYIYSQKIAWFEVDLQKSTSELDVPLWINLDDITYISDTLLTFSEIRGNNKIPVPFQIEQGNPRKLCWVISTGNGTGGKLVFELARGKASQFETIKASVKDGMLTIHTKDTNFLQYCFKTVYPPEGIDSVYKRSGFIHPLWSPHGQVLTRIQPPDHYHHYGIWNPWTHVLFEGDTIDFWNLNMKQGTVRFSHFESITEGAIFSEYKTLHEHIVFKKDGREEVAMNEIQDVRVFRPGQNHNFYIVDFDIVMNCASMSPFKILEYRYAGFGWRATDKWNKNNSMVITSEGKTRADADGSKAKWCIVQGQIDDDYAGILMMSFPTNYNFPEPLRIWPENSNDHGDMFANFCPTKNMDWLLSPRQDYILRYRLLVFNDSIDKEKAENAWKFFSNPPEVKIIK
jgi:hypothetical protein